MQKSVILKSEYHSFAYRWEKTQFETQALMGSKGLRWHLVTLYWFNVLRWNDNKFIKLLRVGIENNFMINLIFLFLLNELIIWEPPWSFETLKHHWSSKLTALLLSRVKQSIFSKSTWMWKKVTSVVFPFIPLNPLFSHCYFLFFYLYPYSKVYSPCEGKFTMTIMKPCLVTSE